PYGGPKRGRIFEGIIQEVAIPSRRVLFEWHSYPRIALRESYVPAPSAATGAKTPPWDYFHVNSIDVEPNGNLLVSARNTHTLYRVICRRRSRAMRNSSRTVTSSSAVAPIPTSPGSTRAAVWYSTRIAGMASRRERTRIRTASTGSPGAGTRRVRLRSSSERE